MPRKLTITVDEEVDTGLLRVVGRRHINEFIEALVRPYVVPQDLDAGYREMAEDEPREAEALAWAEATLGSGTVHR